MVNIVKDVNKTKINMQYVDIDDPFDEDLLNDKEFISKFAKDHISTFDGATSDG